MDRALSLHGELRYAPTERLVGGGTAACAPPPCPLTLQRSESPPATKCGREPPTGGVWQRHFPPRPCRCVLRQGADHHNGHMGHLVPTPDTNCQSENVRASLTLGAPEARPILWRNPGATHRLKPPHTRRYSPAVPPSCTPSQRRPPTRQLRAALSPSNFLQSHLKFPSQLTQVPTAVMQPSNHARSEEVTTSCAPNPVRNKEARPRT